MAGVYVLKYGSDKHRRVLDALLDRLYMSQRHMAKRYSDWADMEEQFMAYLPETEADAKRRKKREQGKPQYTTIVVPYSYAVALTAHTYWTSVFLSRNPVLQFTARHGETQQQVQAVEAVMAYQVQQGMMMVPWYIWLLDPAKYGFGVIGVYWDEEEWTVAEIVEEPDEFMGEELEGTSRKKIVRRKVEGYRGNRIYNVRPQDFFPDPRVPLCRIQDGEFCGRYVEVGWNDLLRGEEDGKYFNLDALERVRSYGVSDRDKGSSQNELPNATEEVALGPPRSEKKGAREDRRFVGLHEIYVELVPQEWGLGESRLPEKWVFTVAEKEVIIGAQPLGLYHNKYPFFVQEYEPNGYNLFARSLLEVMQPMQDTLTWLLNSHLHNVRKVLNDMFVVDPSRVVMKDLLDPTEGRLIRLREEFYGTDPREAIHQLAVVDVTQNHLRDMQVMTDLIQRVSGVTDNIMGMLDPGGRKTATEVRTSSSFGINRLKTVAEYMSAMGWMPMAQVLLQQTQQFYDGEDVFRIAGDLVEGQEPWVKVTPDVIGGFYDFVPVDGTMPVDRFAQAELIRQFVADVASNPMMAGRFDVIGLLNHAMQLLGVRNLGQFRVEVQPEEQVAQQVQQGNLVGLGGGAQ